MKKQYQQIETASRRIDKIRREYFDPECQTYKFGIGKSGIPPNCKFGTPDKKISYGQEERHG
jgi:hypothetical protein